MDMRRQELQALEAMSEKAGATTYFAAHVFAFLGVGLGVAAFALFPYPVPVQTVFIFAALGLLVAVPVGRRITRRLVNARRERWSRQIAADHGVTAQWLLEVTRGWA